MHTTRHTSRNRWAKLLVVAGIALIVTVAVAGPALAGDSSEIIPLSSGTNENGSCGQVSGAGTQQTWKFNVDDLFGDTSKALLFANFSDGTKVNGVAPTTPDDSGNQATWLVKTDAGAKLTSASADVTNANPDGATLIVVSCTLSGEPTTTTVAPTTVPPTTVAVVPAEVTTTTAAAVAPAAELPHTGSTSAPVVALGFLVLAAGLGLMFVSRRAARAS